MVPWMDGRTACLGRSVGRPCPEPPTDRASQRKPGQTATPGARVPGALRRSASQVGARRGRLCRWCLVCGAPVRAFGCLHCTYLLHTCSIGSRQPSSAPARRASRLAISRRVLSVCVLRCRWVSASFGLSESRGEGLSLRPLWLAELVCVVGERCLTPESRLGLGGQRTPTSSLSPLRAERGKRGAAGR